MQEQNFEHALEKLEIIVDKLEKGDLTLEQALRYYQEGIGLSRYCSQKLAEVEGKIELITLEGEKIKKVPFIDPKEVD